MDLRDRFARREGRVPEIVTSSYLGYPLLIGGDCVEVFTPAGRRMCAAASVKQARLLVRAEGVKVRGCSGL